MCSSDLTDEDKSTDVFVNCVPDVVPLTLPVPFPHDPCYDSAHAAPPASTAPRPHTPAMNAQVIPPIWHAV